MSAVDPLAAIVLGAGVTTLLASRPSFSSISLVERIGPYAPGAAAGRRSPLALRSTWGVVLGATGRSMERIVALLGVDEDAGTRLRRVHADTTTTDFRARQVVAATMTAVIAGLAVTVARPTLPLAILAGLLPLLVALAHEQRLIAASDRWRREVDAEIPTISDQLSLLLGAGYSTAAALERLADRGRGCAAADLGRVVERTRHGLDDTEALAEWADLARVDGVERIVRVLTDHRLGPDLERLLADEAVALRRAAHRALIAHLERRNQQVWIPVTVAALVPGSIFIAIPFIHALRAFGVS